ncbi:MAG: beta-galactosidase, partial [Planctomycetia bacterium]|nr:beta-galactosidase [Planctomycetia bacterium]
MYSRLLASLVFFAIPSVVAAADWKPASAPLMTKWGKKVTPENAWKEYPRPQLVRKDWLNLNGLWNYAITTQGAGSPTKWDGEILVPYPIESALSGVGKMLTSKQTLWCSRTFEIPAAWKSKRVLLHFEAVDWHTTVLLNGKELTLLGNKEADSHSGGSDPFSFDITDALKEGKNELMVRVWDPTDGGAQPRGKQVSKPGGIWYTPVTGIWQTVWLEPVGRASIEKVLPVVDFDNGTLKVTIQGRGTAKDAPVWVYVGSGGKKVAEKAGTIGEVISVPIPNPQAWTPDKPHLYELVVELTAPGNPLDHVESYFAFRKISAAKDDKGVMRLMLNNKPLFQIGPLDQGWWPDGLLTPPSDEAMKYDLEVLKKLGFNMLRKHIKVEPARYYYHCDKLGLLVWQDMPSGGVPARGHFIRPDAKEDAKFTDGEKKQFRTELKAMIDHLRFFPCIVVWVPFNEGWGQHDTNNILKWVKEYDPSRLVNGPSGWR